MAGAMVAWASRASLAMARGDWRAAERFARESRGVLVGAQLARPRRVAHDARGGGPHRDPAWRPGARTARSSSAPSSSVHSPRMPLPWFSVGVRLELAHAYLALSDTAGARNVVAEAEAIARRRPALGVLNDRLAEMRQRLVDVSATLAGSSALTVAELRLLPILSTPLTFREIGERMFLSPPHDQDPGDLDLRQAPGLESQRGGRAGDRARACWSPSPALRRPGDDQQAEPMIAGGTRAAAPASARASSDLTGRCAPARRRHRSRRPGQSGAPPQ